MSPPTGAPRHPDDLDLVRRALEGSAGARSRFAQRMRCVPRMLAARNARLGRPLSDPDLEDLTQDTLMTIWRRLATYEGLASLETWAWRFCQHHLANRLRAMARRPVHVPVGGDDAAGSVPPLIEYDFVHRAIERVARDEAVVIRLRHFEQLSFDEIGRHLAISANTAKSRYYRGMMRLRALLEPEREAQGP